MSEITYTALMQLTSVLSIALKERDTYTQLHSDRVMTISIQLAERIGLPSEDIPFLRIASALHDIGKLGIPDEVLLKPSRLKDGEVSVMHSHSVRGSNIVLSLQQEGMEVVAQAIRHHHERYDGHGYPDCLAGDDIPIFSRIITIADNYDAMATRRSYHAPREHSDIIDEMYNECGSKHDPVLFEEFIKLIGHSECRVA